MFSRGLGALLAYWGIWFFVLFLVAAPLALLALASFKATPDALPLEPGPLSFENYRRAFLDPGTVRVLFNTLAVGVFSVALAIVVAGFMAWTTQRTNAPWRKLIYVSMLLPIGVPGMLLAIAWVFLFNPQNGVGNLLLRSLFGFEGPGPINIYSLSGICVLQGVAMVPSCFLMIAGAFRQMDPVLEDAALVAGANWRQIFRQITLPLMSPAVLATTIYLFVYAIEAFEIPGIIGLSGGISVFSSRIYWASHPAGALPEYGYVAALATPFVGVSILLMFLYSRFTLNAESYVTVTGRGYRPRLIDLGHLRFIPTTFALLYLGITVILPLGALVWGSLFPYWVNPSMKALSQASWQAYLTTFNYPGVVDALVNTLIVTVVAATVTMLLASVISWMVVRSNWPGSRFLDTLAFLPHSMPGIVIGLALIFMYITIPIGVYGTVWIIVIACTTKYLAFASRTMNAAQIQVAKELEEAAFTAGASVPKMFFSILFPLLAVPFRNGWLWVGMHAARELSASVMLYGPNSVVLSTILWSMWQGGRLPEACVLGTVLLSITMLLGIVAGFFGERSVTS